MSIDPVLQGLMVNRLIRDEADRMGPPPPIKISLNHACRWCKRYLISRAILIPTFILLVYVALKNKSIAFGVIAGIGYFGVLNLSFVQAFAIAGLNDSCRMYPAQAKKYNLTNLSKKALWLSALNALLMVIDAVFYVMIPINYSVESNSGYSGSVDHVFVVLLLLSSVAVFLALGFYYLQLARIRDDLNKS